MNYNLIPLTNDSEGHFLVTLNEQQLELVTRFNYLLSCWTLDILDAQGEPLQTGLMMIPGEDLLHPYRETADSLGGLLVIESTPGAYLQPDNLGSSVQLLWFAPGATVVYP